jgi:hypothetical protein
MTDKHKGPGRGVVGLGKTRKSGLAKGPPKVERASARGHAGKAVARLAHEVRHERPLNNWGAAKGGTSASGISDTYRDPAQGGGKGPFGKR